MSALDHAMLSRQHIDWTNDWSGEEGATDAVHIAQALQAHAHATLALVEEQRTANLIAVYEHNAARILGGEQASDSDLAITLKMQADINARLDLTGGGPA